MKIKMTKSTKKGFVTIIIGIKCYMIEEAKVVDFLKNPQMDTITLEVHK